MKVVGRDELRVLKRKHIDLGCYKGVPSLDEAERYVVEDDDFNKDSLRYQGLPTEYFYVAEKTGKGYTVHRLAK